MKKETIIKILLLIVFLGGMIFHLCVLFWIIPFSVVWGGKLETREQMYLFEAISLVSLPLIFSMFFINFWHITKNEKIRKFAKKSMWVFFLLFAFNTIGNLFAESKMEMLIATPLTFFSAILCFYLAIRP